MRSHHGRETANMGRRRVARGRHPHDPIMKRVTDGVIKYCTITIEICIKDIYVRNTGRARKDFEVAAMRDDGDDTRSIMGRLQDDLGSPRGRGGASSGRGASERRF